MPKKTEVKYGPRSAKTLGVAVKTTKEFTTPDGMKFDHYSKAVAHVRWANKEKDLINFLEEKIVDPKIRTILYDLVLSHRAELKEILK